MKDLREGKLISALNPDAFNFHNLIINLVSDTFKGFSVGPGPLNISESKKEGEQS